MFLDTLYIDQVLIISKRMDIIYVSVRTGKERGVLALLHRDTHISSSGDVHLPNMYFGYALLTSYL